MILASPNNLRLLCLENIFHTLRQWHMHIKLTKHMKLNSGLGTLRVCPQVTDAKLYEAIKLSLLRSLRHCQLLIQHIHSLGKEIHWHGRKEDEPHKKSQFWKLTEAFSSHSFSLSISIISWNEIHNLWHYLNRLIEWRNVQCNKTQVENKTFKQ